MKRLQIASMQSQGCLLCYELLCFSNILITILIHHVAMPTSQSYLHFYVIISFGILNLHCLLPGLPGSGLIYKSLPCPSLLSSDVAQWIFLVVVAGVSLSLLQEICHSSYSSFSVTLAPSSQVSPVLLIFSAPVWIAFLLHISNFKDM